MKIALAQMNVVAGNPEKNVARMLEMIQDAKNKKANLIVFPEMCVGGYLIGDKWLDEEYCLDLMDFNQRILESSEGIAIAFGNVYVEKKEKHPNKDGRVRKYNAVYVYQNKKPVKRIKNVEILPEGVQPKTLLPNYRIFDDERYFFSLQDVAKDYSVKLKELAQPFLIEVEGKEIPVGFELCEDLWCEDYRQDNEPVNITKCLIQNGAKKIMNLSASPWTYNKNLARDKRIEFLKEESKEEFVPFYYVNCMGAQNNGKNIITFDGGTTVYNSNGEPVLFADGAYKEELIVVDETILLKKELARETKNKVEEKYFSILQGLKHMKDMLAIEKNPKFVIGLSGGIDSSLVACLLERAFGKENVIGVNLPTRYNSDKTRGAAKYLADALEIKYEVVPIEELVTLNKLVLEKDGVKLSELNEENIQAKIRGTTVISNLAAKHNAFFTNNGNKLETALGYATLYGDVGGAIAPIADLTKTEVVQLCHYMNDKIYGKIVIPTNLLPNDLWIFGEEQIQPSAELKNNQIDPMKFGYHCALLDVVTNYQKVGIEKVAQWYKEGVLTEKIGISGELFRRWGLDNPKVFIEDLEWFFEKLNGSVFKRVQAPPIILTSKTAFGYDMRESILPNLKSEKFKKLKQEILKNE